MQRKGVVAKVISCVGRILEVIMRLEIRTMKNKTRISRNCSGCSNSEDWKRDSAYAEYGWKTNTRKGGLFT